LGELWRLSPQPILCLDGDAAGARAAARTAEIALPLLAPERTLKLATLPDGEDPDTLVRRRGAAGFRTVLDAAQPLAEALFGLLRDAVGESTPEQRAALRTRLEAAAACITDRALATEYKSALLSRFFANRPGQMRVAPARPLPRPQPTGAVAAAERARLLTAILLRHPGLLRDVGHAYAKLDLPAPLDRLRQFLLRRVKDAAAAGPPGLMDEIAAARLSHEAEQALAIVPVPLPACASEDAMPADAEAGWWHIFGLMHRGELEQELAAATRAFALCGDAPAQRRLVTLCAARDALRRGEQGNALSEA
jgi:DNA primase